MRYVQLRAFHHVATHGGFSRAAKILSLTQPAISDQIRRLEEQYDILLFNRHNRQAFLTDAGRALLEITRRMFETEQQAFELLSESLALSSGRLRIVADVASHLLDIVTQFSKKYPAIQITISAGNSEQVLKALQAYEADIGISGEAPQSAEFDVLNLSSTPIIAIVTADHPLAKAKRITLADLVDQRLVMREHGSKTRQRVEEAARAQGLELKAALEIEGREAMCAVVATGSGVGFTSVAELIEDSRIVPIELAGPPIFMDEALICLRERAEGKLIKTFFAIARSLAQERMNELPFVAVPAGPDRLETPRRPHVLK